MKPDLKDTIKKLIVKYESNIEDWSDKRAALLKQVEEFEQKIAQETELLTLIRTDFAELGGDIDGTEKEGCGCD